MLSKSLWSGESSAYIPAHIVDLRYSVKAPIRDRDMPISSARNYIDVCVSVAENRCLGNPRCDDDDAVSINWFDCAVLDASDFFRSCASAVDHEISTANASGEGIIDVRELASLHKAPSSSETVRQESEVVQRVENCNVKAEADRHSFW